MDTNKLGEKVEAKILSELIGREIEVLLPFGNSERYDLVICISETYHRLQCKSGRYKQGKIIFSTKSTQPNTSGSTREGYDGDIDYFAVHSIDVESTYLIPISEAAKGEMTLRVDPPGNGQSKGINWAEDYRLDAQLRDIEGT